MLRLLFVLFLGLKLGEVIDWHWFWVVSPALLLGFRGVAREVLLKAGKEQEEWAVKLIKWLRS